MFLSLCFRPFEELSGKVTPLSVSFAYLCLKKRSSRPPGSTTFRTDVSERYIYFIFSPLRCGSYSSTKVS